MRGARDAQPQVCDQCGGEGFRPATRREQLARWFVHGGGAGTAWYCQSCSASWSGGSSYGALYRTSRSGWRRQARLPIDVLEAVRDARTWHPMPLFYAAVGAVAVVPALAVALLTGVRWWVALVGVPVVATVGAFLWSMATAVGHGRDVLWRLAPERAWRADLEDDLTGLRDQLGGFPLVVPEGWPGALTVDGADWSIPPRGPRVLRGVVVVADQGDPLSDPDQQTSGWRPPAPLVEVRYSTIPWDVAEAQALSEFVDRAVPATPGDLDDADQVGRQELERRMLASERDHEQQRQRWEAQLADRWCDGNVQIDGVAVSARLLTHADTDVGVATFSYDGHDVMLIAEGADLEALAFTRVADPTPLVDEFERRRREILAPPTP